MDIEKLFEDMKSEKEKQEKEKKRASQIEEEREKREIEELKISKELAEDNLRLLIKESPSFKSFIDKLWIHEDKRGSFGIWQECDSVVLDIIIWNTTMAGGAHLLRLMKQDYSLDIWEQQSGDSSFSRPVRDSDRNWGKELKWWRSFKDTLKKLSEKKSAMEFFLNLKKIIPMGIDFTYGVVNE